MKTSPSGMDPEIEEKIALPNYFETMARLIACHRYIEILELYADEQSLRMMNEDPEKNKQDVCEHVAKAMERADRAANKELIDIRKIYAPLTSRLSGDSTYIDIV